ncbi:MAG: hypothetical protein GY866_06995 [Proteobacteria bacterium]|nr:hypothetical protein [Pseudomonadota bacterium]
MKTQYLICHQCRFGQSGNSVVAVGIGNPTSGSPFRIGKAATYCGPQVYAGGTFSSEKTKGAIFHEIAYAPVIACLTKR